MTAALASLSTTTGMPMAAASRSRNGARTNAGTFGA